MAFDDSQTTVTFKTMSFLCPKEIEQKGKVTVERGGHNDKV
jgi:hypothetical protein